MGQNTKTVTDQSFQADVLGADKPVLVDFWAEWCGPCRMIAPALEEIAAELGDRKPRYSGPLWRARNPDHAAVQEWRGSGPEGRRRAAQPDPAVAGRSADGVGQQPGRLSRRLGSFEPDRVRPEPVEFRQAVVELQPINPARPEDVKAGAHAPRLVQGGDAEIQCVGLVLDMGVKRRSALPAEAAMPKAARSDAANRRFTGLQPIMCHRHGSEDHRRRAAVELAGPAMAPARVIGLAVQREANRSTKASAGPMSH